MRKYILEIFFVFVYSISVGYAEELRVDTNSSYAVNAFLDGVVGSIPSTYYTPTTSGKLLRNVTSPSSSSTQNLLMWDQIPGIPSFVYRAQVGNSMSFASIDDTRTPSNSQCVDLVKAMTAKDVPTTKWGRGAAIPSVGDDFSVTLAWRGKAIAYFNGLSVYPSSTGHTGIVLTVEYNPNSTLKGVWIVDQNFYNWNGYPFIIAKHYLAASGSGLNNAYNYNAINILP